MPVRISALLLASQALMLLGLSGWVWMQATPLLATGDVLSAAAILDTLLFAAMFLPLGLLGLLSALMLATHRRRAWIPAMLLEAAILGVSLYFYFALPSATVSANGTIYAVMLSCIVMVLYLNTTDVRQTFHLTTARAVTSPAETIDEFTA